MAKRPCVHTARFELRCSCKELEQWRQAASACGLSLSQYLRGCLAKGPMLSRKMQADPALVRQIAGIGNNLNQITWWANTHKSAAEAKPVEEEIKRIRELLEKMLDNGGAKPC